MTDRADKAVQGMRVGEVMLQERRLRALDALLVLGGVALLAAGVLLDWLRLLELIGLRADQLQSGWVQGELVTVRAWCALTGALSVVAGTALWRWPDAVTQVTLAARTFRLAASRAPAFVPLALLSLVLLKTLLQLGLYLIGYNAYGADDFARTFSADYWLYHRTVGPQTEGWLGFAGSVWLPFPDYLFGLALAVKRDLFLTPKVVNLAVSGIAVTAAYFLGRELFGRAAGLITAGLFAFQPWHVWVGISGMTSDLPSLVLITVFAGLMFRWLDRERPRALLAAAGAIFVANGFRHESWFFSAVFSLLLAFTLISRWQHGRLTRPWLVVVLSAVAIVSAFPLLWTAASHYVAGDWMPYFSWLQWRPQQGPGAGMAGSEMTTSQMGYIAIPLLALGAFGFEVALSVAGILILARSDRWRALRQYLAVAVGALLFFAVAFRGQMAASLVFARYLLPFMVVLLPFAGALLARWLWWQGPARNHAMVGATVVLLAVGTFDVLRAFNYPAEFPRDAIYAGWTMRGLQETGTVGPAAKILIERAEDWGDLGVVALANRPERFVVLNEHAYRQTALLNRAANRPAPIPVRADDGVRGRICEADFSLEACRTSVLREGFDLVILSSPARVASFMSSFEARFWNIGRYHIFELEPAGARGAASDRQGILAHSPVEERRHRRPSSPGTRKDIR